jgi:hypothetical protein
MTTTIRERIYARGEVSFAKFLFLSSWFVKLLELLLLAIRKFAQRMSSQRTRVVVWISDGSAGATGWPGT